MKFSPIRLLTLLSSAAIATAAMGQTQGNFAASSQVALNTAPGFIYRADLKTGVAVPIFWEFQIAGKDGLSHLVRVNAATGVVYRNKTSKLGSGIPTSGAADIVTVGENALQASFAKYHTDSQVVGLRARLRKGVIEWKVQLNELNDGGMIDDEDVEVTETGSAAVTKIEHN